MQIVFVISLRVILHHMGMCFVCNVTKKQVFLSSAVCHIHSSLAASQHQRQSWLFSVSVLLSTSSYSVWTTAAAALFKPFVKHFTQECGAAQTDLCLSDAPLKCLNSSVDLSWCNNKNMLCELSFAANGTLHLTGFLLMKKHSTKIFGLFYIE